MNLVDRVVGLFFPESGLRRRRARALLERAYEGASRTDGWRPRRAGASPNTDHRADARELRIRARSLVKNVPYITHALRSLVSSTVGTGIEPRSLAATGAEQLDALWTRWVPQADADGIFDLYGLEAAAYHAMEQDGEVLVRRRPRSASDALAVPLQVQLLEIDWLDSAKQAATSDGGQIINGIEYDPLGKPRSYWLFSAHPGESQGRPLRIDSKPVPAADIIHLFRPNRPGQGRGITRLAPVIARVRDLMLYEDAELQRKNLETRLGLVVSGDATQMSNPPESFGQPGEGGDGKRTYGDLGTLPSGGITEISPGLNMQQIEPKSSSDYAPYVKLQLHLIAAGVGVPYESMTGDMKEVNFSSARIRHIDFRRDCEQMQWLVLVPKLCTGLWRWFVDAAVLGGKAPRAEYAVDWSTPRWDYVNPHQDVKAEVDQIRAGLLSPSESLRRRGYKPDQVFAEMGSDLEKLRASGALELMRIFMSNGEAAAEPTDSTQEA